MKTNVSLLVSALCLVARCVLGQPSGDPIGEHFFAPDLVRRFDGTLQLTADQRALLESEILNLQATVPALERQMREAVQTLGSLVSQEHVDAEKVLAQADQIASLEARLRRTHLALLIRIKNNLTPAQQTKLREARTRLTAIQPKLQRVQTGVERWQQAGRDPTPIAALMSEFEPLLNAGRFDEAEAVLDRALNRLGSGDPK